MMVGLAFFSGTIYYCNSWRFLSLQQPDSLEAKKLLLQPKIATSMLLVFIIQNLLVTITPEAERNNINLLDYASIHKSVDLTIMAVIWLVMCLFWACYHIKALVVAANSVQNVTAKYRYHSYIIPALFILFIIFALLVELLGYAYDLYWLTSLSYSMRLLFILTSTPSILVFTVKSWDAKALKKYKIWHNNKLARYYIQLQPFFETIQKYFPTKVEHNPYSSVDLADDIALKLSAVVSRLNDVRRLIYRGDKLRHLDSSVINKFNFSYEAGLWYKNTANLQYAEETRKLNGQSINPSNAVPAIDETLQALAKHYLHIARKLKNYND
jgi:hypothetical protein